MGAAAIPLVGRAVEMARLTALLDEAAAGTGGVLVISGEPGAGKTRLLEAAVDAAASAGITVRVGRAVDHDVERTLGPALSAFGLRLDELAGPAVATRTVLEAGAPAAGVFLLADRLLEVVESQCATGPLLVAIEDLHWCDTATLAWLRAIGERAVTMPLAVMATTRPVAPGSPVRRTLDLLAAPQISLDPLGADDVRAVAVAVLGQPPDAELTAALDSTGGNPLLVLAVLDRWGRAGVRSEDDPVAVRLAELDAPTLRVLQAAAVLGLRVHPAELGAVVGGTGSDLLGRLDAATRAGFLCADSECVVFRHELHRSAVLGTLASPARALLHLHAAQTLAATGSPAVEVAEHFARGAAPGDREAVRWLGEAALEIVGAAPAGALRLVEQALRLAGHAPPVELLLVHVRALAGTGRSAEAELLGRSLLHDGLDAASEAALRRELSFTALMHGRVAACVAEIERCAELSATPAARARVHGETAFAHFMAIDHVGARTSANQAVLEGARCGDVAAQVAGGAVLCVLDLFANRIPEASSRAETIVAHAGLPGAEEAHSFQPWFVASLVWLEADRLDRLAATARRGREVAVERGAGWAIPGYDAVTAFGALRAGALDDAAATATATLGYVEGVDGLGVAVWCHAFLAQVLLHHGEPEQAEIHLAAADRWLTSERAQLGFEQVQLARAALHERRQAPDAALGALRLVWDMFRAIGALSALAAVGAPLSRLASGAGDRLLLVEVVTTLDDAATASGTLSVAAIAELAAAWRDGDPDRALAAASMGVRSPRPPLAATALADAAVLLREHGRRMEADRVAAEATRHWSMLGAHADATACAVLSRTARPPVRRPRFGVAALTGTERQVVALVADGLSNSGIAAVLGISRRTVESHVSAAYRKLEVASRVALTRTALAHGIAGTASTG